MEFHFEADQEYQLQAVAAVTRLFDGQPPIDADVLTANGGFIAIPNRLDLSGDRLLENLRQVQEENGVETDDQLRTLNSVVAMAEDTAEPLTLQWPNYSVEMETGTGKTYVYIRTALRLFRDYGFRKFIIVVPSIAIREGVLKTFEMTMKHFRELFENTPYHYFVYDSANLTQVRQFALSESLEFMVMTLAAFNKATNVIHGSTDRLQGETPIQLLQATRPILILDEPQNMESERSLAALSQLYPLFALRYSATHRNPYNLVHRLTPYDAYKLGLVKRIEVAGTTRDDFNRPFVRIESVEPAKTVRAMTAKLALHKLSRDGTVKETTISVKPGDDLQAKSNLPQYAGMVVEQIHPAMKTVKFSDGTVMGTGQDNGTDREAIFREQISYTVRQHAEKQQWLLDNNIKVITLFFIDRVDSYVGEDAIVRKLFDEAFAANQHLLPMWDGLDPADVQAAYFAQRKTKSGETIIEDSKSGESAKDEDAYDLIMRDKERMLSFDDKHCFIFSHSALREGWDNPNVFQICTLHQTASEMKKRQEIGRGVRLAVDQSGQRVLDPDLNILTVVANESYDEYVRHLQDEVEQEFGKRDAAPNPKDARKGVRVRINKEYRLRDDFRELWEKINQKTRYSVHIDTKRLVEDVVHDLDQQIIAPPQVIINTGMVTVGDRGFEAIQVGSHKANSYASAHGPLRVLQAMEHLMLQTTPPMRLTRRTLVDIFEKTRNRSAALLNPQEFAAAAVAIIKGHLADQLVRNIKYEKISDWYEMAWLDKEFSSWKGYLEPAKKSYYLHVKCDSGPEHEFVKGLEGRNDVLMYIKLPLWFKVTTPVGDYTPDWAIVMQNPEVGGEPLLYLVRETKSTMNLDELHPDEKRKIGCGHRHFGDALGMGPTGYRHIVAASDLP